ncbi:D-tyrosyl-tRNA(Tyr) deacylase [Planctomycetes bacterium Pla86]|uniref:D-aminoacyl-tRNA deacylase n=1 Tax=Engelhardtia mirabilis TaxID=2528011 RepID=A0A518BPF6_9BACT|nr:D-tyrosyl-tRNA(Tyr) deacylase [Planctomycetes bacterium Pla133]QDV03189.1 D-tyrosyl-tRNA(Tyr) deacylase [Planctomycetes bacterium Pla86]
MVQRVSRARVLVDGEVVGACGPGLLVLLGVMQGDGEAEVRWIADRIAGYRVFADDQGRMNRSALELGREVLVVSQFTLAADGRRGRRPSFDRAAPPQVAEPLYEAVARDLEAQGLAVARGRFGAMMAVELVGDGPATFLLESPSGGSAQG